MLRTALTSLGLMLFTTSCAETQYLTRTVPVPQYPPIEYLQPTPIPGPSPIIAECPAWGEALKDAMRVCNGDKADLLDWVEKERAAAEDRQNY